MSTSYAVYTQRIAREARRANDAETAARNAAAARRAAKRAELQPHYTAVGDWNTAQMKAGGLTAALVAETQRRLDALEAIVAAA